MNAIILYGSRYGASQTYAQALEARTGIPAVAYQEIQDFGPFDTIVYIGGLYAGKTTGLAKTVRHFPTDHSAYWWLRWACPTPPWRTTSCASGSPWPRNSPPASSCAPPMSTSEGPSTTAFSPPATG